MQPRCVLQEQRDASVIRLEYDACMCPAGTLLTILTMMGEGKHAATPCAT